jgi:hypothetical protein
MNEALDAIMIIFGQVRSLGDTPVDIENQNGDKRYNIPKIWV